MTHKSRKSIDKQQKAMSILSESDIKFIVYQMTRLGIDESIASKVVNKVIKELNNEKR